MHQRASSLFTRVLGYGCLIIAIVFLVICGMVLKTCGSAVGDFLAKSDENRARNLQNQREQKQKERHGDVPAPPTLVYIDRQHGLALGMPWEEFKLNALEMARAQEDVYVSHKINTAIFLADNRLWMNFRQPRTLDLNLTHPAEALMFRPRRIKNAKKGDEAREWHMASVEWKHPSRYQADAVEKFLTGTIHDFQRLTGQEGELALQVRGGVPGRVWKAKHQGYTYAVYEVDPQSKHASVHAAIYDERRIVPALLKQYKPYESQPGE